MYLKGEGVARDDAAAFALFQRAAAQGHTGAQIKLASMYADGRGTTKDMLAAFALVAQATSAGDPRGKELLHALEKQLTREQLAEGRERATRAMNSERELSAKNFAQ